MQLKASHLSSLSILPLNPSLNLLIIACVVNPWERLKKHCNWDFYAVTTQLIYCCYWASVQMSILPILSHINEAYYNIFVKLHTSLTHISLLSVWVPLFQSCLPLFVAIPRSQHLQGLLLILLRPLKLLSLPYLLSRCVPWTLPHARSSGLLC